MNSKGFCIYAENYDWWVENKVENELNRRFIFTRKVALNPEKELEASEVKVTNIWFLVDIIESGSESFDEAFKSSNLVVGPS